MERSTQRKAIMGKELRNRRRIGTLLNPGGDCCLIVSISLSGSGTPADSQFRTSAVRSPTDADCTGLKIVVLPSGRVTCTPGTDPTPEGIDPTIPRPLVVGMQSQGFVQPDPPGGSPTKGTAAAAAARIRCYGDGKSGNRVQAVYAVPADRADRYDQVVPSIRQWAAETDGVFQ